MRTTLLIAESISRLHVRIYRIAFIGMRGGERRLPNSMLEKGSVIKAYFSDAERAKEWLI